MNKITLVLRKNYNPNKHPIFERGQAFTTMEAALAAWSRRAPNEPSGTMCYIEYTTSCGIYTLQPRS